MNSLTSIDYHADGNYYLQRLQHLTGCVWLDSGQPGSPDGRYDIFSALPSHTTAQSNPGHLSKALDEALLEQASQQPQDSAALPFYGGWIGFFGYGYRHAEFGLTPETAYQCGQTWFGWYDWALIQDHREHQAILFFGDHCAPTIRAQIITALTQTPPSPSFSCGPFQPGQSKEDYLKAVDRVQDYILAGDCYQTNYTQRFSAQFSGSCAAAYQRLRQAIPSPFSAFLSLPSGSHILSISPERFIRVQDNEALTQPIKGTALRGLNTDEDRIQGEQLRQSPKNRAENLMIVDLLRNDFSKNCLPHSVQTPGLFELHSFANVHHLISTVTGKLKPRVNHADFILDCFPGGSITGAPKKRAMQIIAELETHPRGVYCGAIGYFSRRQRSDFSIAIRTLLQENNEIYCWGGGGIVADSEPELEYQESWDKINRLLQALQKP